MKAGIICIAVVVVSFAYKLVCFPGETPCDRLSKFETGNGRLSHSWHYRIDLRGNVLVQTWHNRKVYKSNVIWILGQKHQAFSTFVARITWCPLGRYAVDLQCIIKSSTTVMLICHKRGHLHICECVLYIFYSNYFFYYFYFDLLLKKPLKHQPSLFFFLFCLLYKKKYIYIYI